MKGNISHEGIVVAKVAADKYAIKIIQQSACATCHAAALCTAAESKEKIIEATAPHNATFEIGDNVIVYGKTSLGYKALMLAFVIPLIISLITLIITVQHSNNELTGGILALAILVPYYAILALMHKKIQREFAFYIRYNNIQ